MIAQLVRMTAKALADPTVGCNAQIALLSLDATVAGVTDTRPANIVSVKNQFDHNIETQEAEGESQFPLWVVLAKSPFAGQGQVWTSIQDALGDIHCVLVTRGGTAAKKILDADYYIRAGKRAIHAYLLTSANRDVNGVRNNIKIKSAPHMEASVASGSLLGGEAAAILKVTFDARDLNP